MTDYPESVRAAQSYAGWVPRQAVDAAIAALEADRDEWKVAARRWREDKTEEEARLSRVLGQAEAKLKTAEGMMSVQLEQIQQAEARIERYDADLHAAENMRLDALNRAEKAEAALARQTEFVDGPDPVYVGMAAEVARLRRWRYEECLLGYRCAVEGWSEGTMMAEQSDLAARYEKERHD